MSDPKRHYPRSDYCQSCWYLWPCPTHIRQALAASTLSDAEVETIYAAYDEVAGSEAKTIDGKRRIVEPIYKAVIAARIESGSAE